MPREQVEWCSNQSSYDGGDIHARQSSTYCSIVNINKTKCPFSSTFEQQQTWTLTRTVSNNHKRYQSSIENIHLTVPNTPKVLKAALSNTDKKEFENEKHNFSQSVSLLPPLPPSRQHSCPANRSNRQNSDLKISQQSTSLGANANSKSKSTVKKSQALTNLMRIMHVNGEFIVRI